MTDEEQKLYDVIADWWEDVFCAASYKGKDASLLDLVHSIMDLKYYNVPEDADPYNLRGRLPMEPVKKNNDT
jgi:hypothetical protein